MFYHGTTAELQPGDFVSVGYPANFRHDGTREPEQYVWFSEHVDLAETWGIFVAEKYGGEVHIYEVIPTGEILPDRGIATGQVGKGNFQSRFPLRVLKEVEDDD